jgi:hypothetical protein
MALFQLRLSSDPVALAKETSPLSENNAHTYKKEKKKKKKTMHTYGERTDRDCS